MLNQKTQACNSKLRCFNITRITRFMNQQQILFRSGINNKMISNNNKTCEFISFKNQLKLIQYNFNMIQ